MRRTAARRPSRSFRIHPGIVILVASSIAVSAIIIGWAYSSTHIDTQCITTHATTTNPPTTMRTASDYFNFGNYNYERGDCREAIINYSHAIELNPSFAQAYNNRAYTYMRMRNYTDALSDVNRALEINPNYVQALMNRGDLYNYYGPVMDPSQAISDYDRVIALGATVHTSVCGHRAVAIYKLPGGRGWNIFTYLQLISQPMSAICRMNPSQ